MLLGKTLEEIREGDLQRLTENGVAENRHLEYKLELPTKTHEDRREFLADVVAFANSVGGMILFGIDEQRDVDGPTTGIAGEVVGLSSVNIDEEIRRLENSIRDGTDPRVMGTKFLPVKLSNGNVVLALDIPRSWNGPHAVDYQRHWRFYYRDSVGKHPMDVAEVRSLISLSDGLSEQVRRFRAERMFKIEAGETPIGVVDSAKLVLHLMPLESFAVGKTVEIVPSEEMVATFGFPPGESLPHRHNLDGILIYSREPETAVAEAYTQVFRNGIVETIDTQMLSKRLEDGTPIIPSPALEKLILDVTRRYLGGLAGMGVSPPILGYLTLIRVEGYKLCRHRPIYPDIVSPHQVDRRNLALPELFIEELMAPSEVILKPAFDALWSAVGWPRCELYDEEGHWRANQSRNLAQ